MFLLKGHPRHRKVDGMRIDSFEVDFVVWNLVTFFGCGCFLCILVAGVVSLLFAWNFLKEFCSSIQEFLHFQCIHNSDIGSILSPHSEDKDFFNLLSASFFSFWVHSTHPSDIPAQLLAFLQFLLEKNQWLLQKIQLVLQFYAYRLVFFVYSGSN